MLDQYNANQVLLYKALVSFVSETKDVHADSTNPFHKNKYASLSAHLASIKPIAAKNGLAIIQMPIGERDAIGIQTIVVHVGGGSIQQTALIPCSKDINGQQAGAVYSYLRRYALAAIAGVATEDDDAEIDRLTRAVAPSSNKIQTPPRANPAGKPSQSSFDDLIVPFGKSKGQKLNELDDYNLGWWANTWEPKPWEKTGKVNPKDVALKSGAVKLWNERQNKNDQESVIEEMPEDDVPF